MKILVIGGTRLMGKYLVRELIAKEHEVTIATRGLAEDSFGKNVRRIIIDRYNEESIEAALQGRRYDVVYDNLAYGSSDVMKLMPHINTDRFISISSTAVCKKHINTKEEDFDPAQHELVLCERNDLPYSEVKRQAEVALFCKYANIPSVAVRFPFAVSIDDHTRRLHFYIEHMMKGIPIYIDNIDARLSFVHSAEAGRFLAFLCDSCYTGIINGASRGTVSLREIIDHAEFITGKRAILCHQGDSAPYNGEVDYSINVDRAVSLGFVFSDIHEWIYDLIEQICSEYAVKR